MSKIVRALALLLFPVTLASAGLISQSGARYHTQAGGGGGGEAFGAYLDMDLSVDPIYRIDMSAQDYVYEAQVGSTHTYEATGAWDGGPCAKFTPPTTADGRAGLQIHLDNDGTFAIHQLNIRWEASFGSTYETNFSTANDDVKYVIVHTAATLGGGEPFERPMINWLHQATQSDGRFALAVAAGTVKQFNPNPPPDEFGPDGSEEFYIGPTETTFNSKRVVGPSTWLTFEVQVVAQSTGAYPDGLIRVVVTDRDGTVLTDLDIPWDYDAAWNTLPRYIREIQTIGGWYNQAYDSVDANTWHRIAGPTVAVNYDDADDLLGPRAGFVQ